MPKLSFRNYSPAIGGHAPGHVRDAFIDAIDQYEAWEAGQAEPTVEIDGRDFPISEVCGLVWNCTDILPGAARNAIEDLLADQDEGRAFRGTYGAGARALKSLIAEAIAA